MATVGQFFAFLNALRETACSEGRASPTVEVMQAWDLGFTDTEKHSQNGKHDWLCGFSASAKFVPDSFSFSKFWQTVDVFARS